MCLCVCAVSLRDDFRAYLPELLPRFIGLFAEAERSGSYDQVPAALHALEALGGALEDHLQLLLPALVRLICVGRGLPLKVNVYVLTYTYMLFLAIMRVLDVLRTRAPHLRG